MIKAMFTILKFIFIRREVPTGGWVNPSKYKFPETKDEYIVPLTKDNIRKIISWM